MNFKKFLFQNLSTSQGIIKNTTWLWIGQAGSQIIRTIVIIYATRIIGASGYGIFANAVGIIGFFIIFSDLGLNAILTKESAQTPKTRSSLISAILPMKLLLIALSFLTIILIGSLVTNIELTKKLLPLAAIIFALDALKDFGLSLARSLEKMEIEAIASLSGALTTAISAWLFLKISPTPVYLLYAYLIGSLTALLIIFSLEKKYLRNIRKNFRIAIARPIMKSALLLASMDFLGSILIYSDIIILGWFRTAQEIGLYNAAQKPVQLLYLVSGILSTSLLPVFSRLVTTDKNKLKLILEKSTKILLLIGIPLTLIIFLLSENFINLLYGNAFLEAANVLKIIIFTLLFIYPFHIITTVIFAHNRQNDLVKYWAIAAVSNLVLNLILIPSWGILGAATASLSARIIAHIPMYFKAQQIQPFRLLSGLKNTLLAAATMSIVIIFLKISSAPFGIILIIAIAIYGLLLFLFKEPLINDIILLKKTFLFWSKSDEQTS